jgi:hypothetical protein
LVERSLQTVLASLSVVQRPGHFYFVDLDEVPAGAEVQATVVETEGTTAVVELEALGREVLPTEFAAAWLTIETDSALDLVGLTAVLSQALAGRGIACNVLAGLHHDHLLVPATEAGRAIAILDELRGR